MTKPTRRVRRVLRIVPTLDPRFGGPVAAMTATVHEMSRRNISTDVLVADDCSLEWNSFANDAKVRVVNLGRSRTSWRFVRGQRRWLTEHLAQYDLVIVHGIWPHGSFAAWQAARIVDASYVVFVHGSLDPWYRRGQPLKYLKKWLTWPWAQYRIMRDADAVLFTTTEESELAAQSFRPYSCRPVVVRYGVEVPASMASGVATSVEAPYFLYLGRIHRKKGLDLLIRGLALNAAAGRSAHLVIAGADQAGLQPKLVDLARVLGVHEDITWLGHVSGEAKWDVLRNASALVMPSHTENFGVSVAEGLGCGVPALVTNKVNISPLVQDAGAGFVAPDDVQGVTSLLERFLSLSDAERDAMRRQARSLYSRQFTVEGAVDDLLALAPRASPSSWEDFGS